MIKRVRRQDGSTVVVDKAEAIEVLDEHGRLAVVVLVDRKDTTHILTPGDALFNAYCRSHGMVAGQVHKHEAMPVATSLNPG
jgi:hypothetical protein